MLPHTLIALLLAGSALSTDRLGWEREALGLGTGEEEAAVVHYQPEARAVTNWRTETVGALEPKPVALLAAAFRADRPVVTRCVKLNNYWCIKSARWDGEIGRDGEGHVGFASAEQGADAAARLLRRYYLEFHRKSALEIVRRWAPAECNVATGIGGLAVLAVRGIGGTVRARWLASHKGVKLTAQSRSGKPGRVSIVIPMGRPMSRARTQVPEFRVPDIAAGMGEKPKPKAEPRAQRTVASRKPVARQAAGPAPTAAASACAPDEQRLRNYAARIVEDLDLGPSDDLKLFSADGAPLPNLGPVMLAMSAVELGMLRASPELVQGALRRMGERVTQAEGTEKKR